MRSITDFTNHDAPDTDYPYGKIRDNNGTNNGTPVNEATYGDIHQLMARVMHYSRQTSNGLPDNDYNGFQLFDAFTKMFNKYSKLYLYNPTGSPLSLAGENYHNSQIQVIGSTSGGMILFPDQDSILEGATVVVTNYNSDSGGVLLSGATSSQYIGGHGSTNITYTLPDNTRAEFVYRALGNLWLKVDEHAIS